MPRYKKDEIACFQDAEGEIFCPDCMSEDEKSSLTADRVMTYQSIDSSDDYVFCGRCNKRIRSEEEG